MVQRAYLAAALVCSLPSLAPAQCLGELFAPTPVFRSGFGTKLALDGPFAVVAGEQGFGAPEARVHFLVREAGVWRVERELAAPLPTYLDSFGGSVAIDGDTALVGEPRLSSSASGAGGVWVYSRGTGGWERSGWLEAAPPLFDEGFGTSAALDGDLVLVGAPASDRDGPNQGAVFVFERAPGGFQPAGFLRDPGPAPTQFGRRVAIEGERAVVTSRERGHVFERNAQGFPLVARLEPPVASERFGASLALSGDRALVGDPGSTVNDVRRAGTAFVFERSPAGTWQREAVLSSALPSEDDSFGAALALALDRAWVGAPGRRNWLASRAGRVRAFERTGAGWTAAGVVRPLAARRFDQFGASLAADGATLAIGAPGDDRGASGAGAVTLFSLAPSFATRFCTCDASSAPCGNAPMQDTGCENVSQRGASLVVCGSSSVARDDLVLVGGNLPANALVVPFFGTAAAPTPFGDGLRCVGGPGGPFRLPALAASGSGRTDVGPGLAALSRAQLPAAGHLEAGDTRAFQLWYRDSLGPCGSGSNVSDALSIVFRP